MEKYCCVISGFWEFRNSGEWEFVTEKRRMGRTVCIKEMFMYEDLCDAVRLAFGEEKMKLSLSYWNTDYERSGIGRMMPPMKIENDCGVKHFLKLLSDRSDRHLLVTFSGMDAGVFKTPVSEVRKKRGLLEGQSSNSGTSFETRKRPSPIRRPEIFFDEDGLLEEVEAMEEQMRSNEKSTSKEPSFNLIDEDDLTEGVEIDVAEKDVRFGGYDTEFWEPLVEELYGCSNAVEVMCNTNSVFDHVVRLGGNGERDQYAKFEEGNVSRITNSGMYGKGSVNGSTGQQCGGKQSRRNLSDVPDEEFDVEPMFDDTTYEAAEIPDLDRDETDEEIYVGKTFGSKLDCQISLAIYAIKNMFYFKQTRSNKNYIVVNCADLQCDWRVTAYEMKDSCYYQIRKASLGHSCSIETRSQYYKLVSSKVIAAIYRSKFSEKCAGPKPLDLQQLLLEELRVASSYTKCWKAIEVANVENQGSHEDSYLNLLHYLHMLKRANPGTIGEVETEDDGLGGERFLYLFLAFGASIIGFRNLRTVLVLDGTHLSGKYKGVLLTVSGQDAKFQVFPLAFGIVDSENEEAWSWFLTKVKSIIADSPRLTIISDRAKSIIKVVRDVFPEAHHGACIVHLSRNVVSKFKSKGLAKLVTQAACAYKVGQFRLVYGQIEKSSVGCARYLQSYGLETWTRVYFGGDRYNMMTSNLAESLNNALRNGRKSPIIELLMFIQSMLTRWFSARRLKSETHRGFVTPQVDKVLTSNLSHAKGFKVNNICPGRYEVIGQFGDRHTVDLNKKQCTCRFYDSIKIPCGHVVVASSVMGLSYGQACAGYYSTTVWRKTYLGVVEPHEDPKEGDIPDEIRNRYIRPPKTRRPPGRPKQKRIPSIGEISSGSSSKSSTNRCGRCKGIGHNRSSCKNPI